MEKIIPPQHTRKEALFQFLLEIPRGKVATYGDLARILGTSPRAVASMLSSNRDPDVFPCYKVVASDGKISGYALGVEEKIRRLSADGLEVSNGKIEKSRIYRFG